MKCKKAKWLSEEALKIAEERREVKGKGERERYTQLNALFQRIARRDKKAFLHEQCKEIEENSRMGKTRDFFKKIGDAKGILNARMGTTKDRNGKDLTEAEEIKRLWQENMEKLYKKDLKDLQTTVMCSCTKSWIYENVKSSGPSEASLRTMLVEVMEFQLNYLKS